MNVSPFRNRCAKQLGFSLVELLVVLVIVSATTALLVSGFSITWKNFSKLSQRDLLMNSNLMGERWLRESVNDAVLYHPDTPNFIGDAYELSFISKSVPWNSEHIPTEISWTLVEGESFSNLQISSLAQPIQLVDFPLDSQFQYLYQQRWQSSFAPSDAELPYAFRIVHQGNTLFYATFKRPGKAEVPPEMVTFGEYEFGG
jgi:prepilin-type N-terminal cleavage/methylation domain-containing protein